MINKNRLVILIFLCSTIVIPVQKAKKTTSNTTNKIQAKEENKKQKVLQTVKTEISIINKFFANKPTAIARIKLSADTISKTLSKIQTNTNLKKDEEEKVIQELVKQILEPIKNFLKDIYDYAIAIKPIVEAISEDLSNSLLAQFFNEKEDRVNLFFEENIKSVETFQKTAQELLNLFDFFLENLSEEAQKSYNNLIQKMKNNKKQKK